MNREPTPLGPLHAPPASFEETADHAPDVPLCLGIEGGVAYGPKVRKE